MKYNRPLITRLLERSQWNGECLLWTGYKNDRGYGGIRVRGKDRRVHRLSFELFIGPIENNLCVCHTCDIRNCINPSHLFLGTHQDNSDDARSKGRTTLNQPKGEIHCKTNLTNKQI